MGPGQRRAALRALHSDYVRPVLLLLLIIVLWDVSIRVFRIPPYQIPAPADVRPHPVPRRPGAAGASSADADRDARRLRFVRHRSAFRSRC